MDVGVLVIGFLTVKYSNLDNALTIHEKIFIFRQWTVTLLDSIRTIQLHF